MVNLRYLTVKLYAQIVDEGMVAAEPEIVVKVVSRVFLTLNSSAKGGDFLAKLLFLPRVEPR